VLLGETYLNIREPLSLKQYTMCATASYFQVLCVFCKRPLLRQLQMLELRQQQGERGSAAGGCGVHSEAQTQCIQAQGTGETQHVTKRDHYRITTTLGVGMAPVPGSPWKCVSRMTSLPPSPHTHTHYRMAPPLDQLQLLAPSLSCSNLQLPSEGV